MLGRLQNEVFAVLRPQLVDHAEALDLAHRIRGAVCSGPIRLPTEQIRVPGALPVSAAPAGPSVGERIVAAPET